ncbi:MAG: FGGY-family carbohydrate kinase, partial [Gemmatimonadota bacterium]
LESMAQSTADVIEAMTAPGDLELTALRVDGGAARNDWLLQAQADLIGQSVIRPEASELTAIGAAGLAGVGAGAWKGPEQLEAARGDETEFVPRPETDQQADARRRDWRRAIRAVLEWTDAGGDE